MHTLWEQGLQPNRRMIKLSCFENSHVKKLPFSRQDPRRKVKYFMNISDSQIQGQMQSHHEQLAGEG